MMQAQSGSFDKISSTALMAASSRQATDIPYAKELAQLLKVQAVTDPLQEQQLDVPVGLAVLTEGRYKAINRVMAQFRLTQILELASGLLPRGMAMSEDPGITFLESDLPTMISRKQKLVRQLIGERLNLHFTAIDATSRPNQFPLHADYFQQDKPVVILCEGLLMYLTLTEKKQVFANVREMLQVYGGVWITSDLATLDSLNWMAQDSPAPHQVVQMLDGMTGRSLKDNFFVNLDHIQQFASEQGFWVEEYSTLNVLDQLTCLQPLGINPGAAESILTGSSVFTLTLHNV